jgi:NADH-quinone oxidoreductase subunit G
MVIVGQGAFVRADGLAVLSQAARVVTAVSAGKDAAWNGFNVLHTAAGRVAGLDVGFVPGKGGKDAAGILGGGMDFVYLLGADESDLSKLGTAFVVYQGSHGDRGAERADVILPGAAYTEKGATYVNTEGRVQQTTKAAFSPGSAKEDWTILRALSARAGKTLPYDTLKDLRAAMYKAAPQLAEIDAVETRAVSGLETLAKLSGQPTATAFASAIEDFYLTNAVARASAVMAGMSALRSARDQRLSAAE